MSASEPGARPSCSAWIALAATLAMGCAEPTAPPPGASATASAAAPSASTSTAAAPAPDVDASVLAKLDEVAPCPRDAFWGASRCPAVEAWEKWREAFAVPDDIRLTRSRALVAACATRLQAENESVREEAYACVEAHVEAVPDAAALARAVLARLPGEKSPQVRHDMLELLHALDVTRLGLVAEAVAFARSVRESEYVGDLDGALEALRPRDEAVPVAPEAAALARELLGAGLAVGEAVALLERSEAPAAELCALYLAVVRRKDALYTKGLDAMARTHGTCPAEQAEVVGIVVARAGAAERDDTGLSWSGAMGVKAMADAGAFSPAQRKELTAAVKGARERAPDDALRRSRIDELLEALR